MSPDQLVPPLVISRAELDARELNAKARGMALGFALGAFVGFAIGFAPLVPELVRRVMS